MSDRFRFGIYQWMFQASLILGLLTFYLSMTTVCADENPQITGSAKGEKSPILHFPKFKSMGRLYIVDGKDELSNRRVNWKLLGPAQGDVTRPAGAELGLRLSYEGAQDFLWMEKLKANDLLILDNNNIAVNKTQFHYLARLTGLKRIELDGSDISDQDFACFKDLRHLVLLNVSHTLVKGAGLSSLKNLKELKSLYMSHNLIDGAKLVDLQNLTSLQYLHLDESYLSDNGVAAISKVKSVRELLMASNPKITDAGVESLSRLPNLRALDLVGASVTRKSFPSFKKMHLHFLRIQSPSLSAHDLNELKAILAPGKIAGPKVTNLDLKLFSPLR